MIDYKKLIRSLRRNPYYKTVLNDRGKAADAIEQLGRDNDVLTKERDEQNNYIAELHEEVANLIITLDSERNLADEWQHDYFELATKLRLLEEERDAAVADIPHECFYCAEVKTCKDTRGTCGNWQWRGVEGAE